jgi:hypothetical protein
MTAQEIIHYNFKKIGIHDWEYINNNLIYHSQRENNCVVLGASEKFLVSPWTHRTNCSPFYSRGVKYWTQIRLTSEIPNNQSALDNLQLFAYIAERAVFVLSENYNYTSPTGRWIPLAVNFINEKNLQKVHITL